MFVLVQIVDEVGLFIVPTNAEIGRIEDFAQLVADQVDDRLEIQLGGEPLLDRVDDRELGVALFEVGVRRRQFPRAFLDLVLEALRPLRVVQRDRGLAREHPQQVAVGLTEAPESAVDIDVEIAQQLALRDQRRDDARALVELVRALGAMRQA